MSKRKNPRRGLFLKQKSMSLKIAEKAIEQIAVRDHTTPEMVRKHIQLGMLNGLMSEDPRIQAEWKRIPCAGEVPTPEEVIAFYARKLTKS